MTDPNERTHTTAQVIASENIYAAEIAAQLEAATKQLAEVAAQAEAMRDVLSRAVEWVARVGAENRISGEGIVFDGRAALALAPSDALAVHDARLLARVAMLREALTTVDELCDLRETHRNISAHVIGSLSLSETADVDAWLRERDEKTRADAVLPWQLAVHAEAREYHQDANPPSTVRPEQVKNAFEDARADERRATLEEASQRFLGARHYVSDGVHPTVVDYGPYAADVLRALSTTPGNGAPAPVAEPRPNALCAGCGHDYSAHSGHTYVPGPGVVEPHHCSQVDGCRQFLRRLGAPEKKPCATCGDSGWAPIPRLRFERDNEPVHRVCHCRD